MKEFTFMVFGSRPFIFLRPVTVLDIYVAVGLFSALNYIA